MNAIPDRSSRDEKLKRLRSRLDELNRTFPLRRAGSLGTTQPTVAGVSPATVDALRPILPTPRPREPAPIVLRRDRPRLAVRQTPLEPRSAGAGVALGDLLDGDEARTQSGARYFEVVTPVDSIGGRQSLSQEFVSRVASTKSGAGRLFRESAGESADSAGALFMDIETTGLHGCPLFLIGIMRLENGVLAVRQLLARDYAEEAAVVEAYASLLASATVLVTFNGKSFDVPFIRARSAVAGVRLPNTPPHIDLLHESRRVWGGRFVDCRLQTLECEVCGHEPRVGDIPGAQIGDAYHAYVRTGDARDVARILTHNLLDLVTLAEILAAIP